MRTLLSSEVDTERPFNKESLTIRQKASASVNAFFSSSSYVKKKRAREDAKILKDFNMKYDNFKDSFSASIRLYLLESASVRELNEKVGVLELMISRDKKAFVDLCVGTKDGNAAKEYSQFKMYIVEEDKDLLMAFPRTKIVVNIRRRGL